MIGIGHLERRRGRRVSGNAPHGPSGHIVGTHTTSLSE